MSASAAALAEAEPRVVEYEAHDYQLDTLESDKRLVFVGAGVGAGKTDVGTLWMLLRAKETPPGVIGLIAANTYGQLFDATLRKVFKALDAFGVPHRPRELPRSHAPFTLEVWNGSHWVEILCRSMESYENLSGVELGWFWLDEVWQTLEAAYKLILARLRDPRMRNRGLLTTTLDDPGSWMYEEFVNRFDAATQAVLYAPTEVNRENLGDEYIATLRRSYSEREAARMLDAAWVFLTGAVIYYAFSRDANVTTAAEFDPALPILWSLDFNIGQGKPMSSCLAQMKKGPQVGADGKPVLRPGPRGEMVPTIRPELHFFDEIILDSTDTNDAAEECKGRLAKLGVKDTDGKTYPMVRVYGDASGKAQDTRSKTTDYGILRSAGFIDQRVPDANPPIRTRHNTVNALLRNAAGDVRAKAHPRCRTLIKGWETVKLRKGASYLEEETREQHVTTAAGYLACVEVPIERPPEPQVVQRPW